MTEVLYEIPTNLSDVVDFIGWTTEVSGGVLWPMILFIIGTITFLGTKQFTTPIAFAFSSFITALISIPLAILGWLAPAIMYFCFVLFAMSLVALRVGGSRRR